MFIHELPDAKQLFIIVANEKHIDPYLVEKDYWITHVLWGLGQQEIKFELKGGTSLSKGYGIIDRFSEDVDVKIHPSDNDKVKIGINHQKATHVKSRELFFDDLTEIINIPGMQAIRDHNFDNKKTMRSAGIRLNYDSFFSPVQGIKAGILLEAGFDKTTPNKPLNFSSWAHDKLQDFPSIKVNNNKAYNVLCYCPEYTFVEKLQAISTKVRLQQETGEFSTNFLRHFYDVSKLLEQKVVINFIGTKEYLQHKNERFRTKDNKDITKNLAFNLDKDADLYKLYKDEFEKTRSLFFTTTPNFDEVYATIVKYRENL
jgi:predicted nucleotidyltransferase component of viral defense system